jgi:cation:H+ antiporter
MLLAVLLLIAGAVVLIAGAESAVRGASRLALAVGIPAFALGALLFGIDLEGLSSALLAAGRGQTQLAAGEAFGTITFLIGVAFAVALLFSKQPIESPDPLMVWTPAVCITASAMCVYDRYVSRAEGLLLVGLYVGYVLVVVADGRAVRQRAGELEHEAEEVRGGSRGALLLTLIGLGAVSGGAWLLVEGGVRILSRTGLAAGFVGAAIVGALASLDEVLLEVLPVVRGTPQLATGNLFGTVAAFPSVVLGLSALIRPLDLDSSVGLSLLAGALLYCIVATIFLVRGRVSRPVGLVLLALYAAWLAYGATL